MPTLSSSIVKQKLASMRDVEEALARQVLYGGDLATNLLELAAVSEGALTTLLAESHELLPAPVGELPRASATTLEIVPGDLALRHGFYPLGERDGELVIAVSEPLPPEIEQDLSFSLGATLAQRAAPLVRIRQAVSRDYDLPMDRRTLRLVAKLEGRPDPSPSSIPAAFRNADSIPALPRPASVPPMPYPTTLITPRDARDGAPVERSSPPVEMSGRGQSSELRTLISPRQSPSAPQPEDKPSEPKRSGQRARGRKRHRGPYTAAMAEADLMEAESRDDVLGAFFDFASQFFEYSALFAVHSDLAEGRDADGPGTDRSRIRGIGVPLDLPGVLSTTRAAATWQLLRLERDGLDASLAKDLERRSGAMVAIVPVVVRGRCVLLLYGDLGAADVGLDDIGDVLSFAPLAAAALERVIMLRKMRARGELADGAMPTPISPPARRRHTIASADQRRDALARAFGAPPPSEAPPPKDAPSPKDAPPPRDAPPPTEAPSTDEASPQARKRSDAPPSTDQASPGALRSEPPKSAPFAVVEQAPATVAASPGARKSDEPPSTAVEAPRPKARASSIPSRPMVRVGANKHTPPHGTPTAEGEAKPFPLTRRPISSPPATEELPEEDAWDETDGSDDETPQINVDTARGLGRGEPLPSPPPTSDSSPRLELVGEDEVDPEELAREYKRADSDSAVTQQIDSREVPLAPSSRKVAYGPLRPRKRHSSPGIRLPSVIIDLEADCQHLVDRLENGDEAAGDRLVEMGEPAVLVLVARFPGPIHGEVAHRFGENSTRASDCGPILRTLARIGDKAGQYLIVRTADGDPKTRRWATWLLGEIPSCDGARAIVRRASDEDADVRKAAVAAGRMLQRDLDARTALRDGLATLASDPEQPQENREAAVEALADIRDGRAVPRLIPLLKNDSQSLVKSAAWALSILARQGFDQDSKAWSVWWAKHSSEHRVEWLITSLMHEDTNIRRAAGEELKAITKEYFGYYEDLPKKERARVQRKYTEWWEEKGKARFY